MGSYSGLHVKGKELIWWKNGLSPMITGLFTKDEIYRGTGLEGYELLKKYDLLKRYEDLKPDDIDWEIALAVIDIPIIKQRLSIYGYNKKMFDEAVDREVHRLKEYINEPDDKYELKEHYEKELKKYESIKDGSIPISEMSYELFEQIDFYDEAAKIWAVIQHKDITDSDVAIIDLDDLIEGGWLNDELENEDSKFLVTMDDFIPDVPVLITEGVTDKRILEKSLSVIYPKLVSNVKFLNMDFKPENGVASVVKMVKSFAAAGIRNRILVILDNDSAASEALMSLPKHLPDNIKIIQYPNLAMLKNYPTIGPQGNVLMDVNGLAGSIEMYVGRDILMDKEGELEIIQWGGYMSKVKKYQGSLINKENVQKRFEDKDDSKLEGWNDLKYLWDYIIENLSTL